MKILTLRLLPFVILASAVSCRRDKNEQSVIPKPLTADASPIKHSPGFENVSEFTKKYIGIGNEVERSKARVSSKVDSMVEGLSAAELGQLLDQFDLGKECNDPLVASAMRVLVRKDPALFIEYISKFGQNTWLVMNQSIAGDAINANRLAVIDWLRNGEIGGRQSPSYALASNFLNNLSKGDPFQEVQLLLERKGDRDGLLMNSYSKWAKADPGAALSHATKSLQGNEMGHAVRMIFICASNSDPVEAYRLADSIDPKIVGNAFGGLFSNLAKKDIFTAISVLGEMPAERIQTVLSVPGQAEAVASIDSSAAIQALSKLAFTKTTEQLFTRVAVTSATREPVMVKEWVSGFPDSPSKQKLLDQLYDGK